MKGAQNLARFGIAYAHPRRHLYDGTSGFLLPQNPGAAKQVVEDGPFPHAETKLGEKHVFYLAEDRSPVYRDILWVCGPVFQSSGLLTESVASQKPGLSRS
jgi:hypothetical protein